ncbi:hypothetical protein Tco_1201473 [Tanacetum coccineum]
MQEAVDVAVQLKYDKIREESSTANQQFLETIDDGMKKIIKEHIPIGDTVTIKRPRDGQMMMKNPPLEQTGVKRRRSEKGTAFIQCSKGNDNSRQRTTTGTGSKDSQDIC